MHTLRQWRTQRLLSLHELAQAAGIAPKTLTDLEYGRRRPTYGTMRRLCAALEVTPAEVTEFAAAMEQHAAVPAPSPADD